MAFFEKGLHLGARKEEGSRYDKDTLKREKGNQERKGAVAVRTTGRAGGGEGGGGGRNIVDLMVELVEYYGGTVPGR